MIILKQIPLLTTQTLLDMHGAIRKCLKEDDASATKKWFTREEPDWRIQADGTEAELNSRGARFDPIVW